VTAQEMLQNNINDLKCPCSVQVWFVLHLLLFNT